MASGKLTFYLKHGKPVLVSNFLSLSQLVEKYKFGIVINEPSDPQEIKTAIDKIISSYSMYSNNARLCFEQELDFGKKMESILSFIDSL
jgi:glycosyltransferase involved in cell wall biosynthesis